MKNPSRREFLQYGLFTLAAMAPSLPKLAYAASNAKTLAFYNLHTAEKLHLTYYEYGRYIPQALQAISHLLRDYRTGGAHAIDIALLDQLHHLQQLVDRPGPFHVISGYRSPKTNGFLHARSGGVARHSMHIQGRAIDIRLPGKDLEHLHKAAVGMQAGGVGYYPASDFIHIDTGHVRQWEQLKNTV